MASKRFVVVTIAYTLIALVLTGLLVMVVDPFVRYHAPWFGLTAAETDERSSVIGMARNLDYDTALIGSSMSENFRRSWFEDGVFGQKCVKLPLQGAHYGDYEPVIQEVLEHPGTKNVVFCLDIYLFSDAADDFPRTIEDWYMPGYGIGDIRYLLNKSVVFDYLPRFLINNVWKNYDNDDAYVWSGDYQFSEYVARAAYTPLRILSAQEEKPYDFYFENADRFTDAFIEQIDAHPDVTFYLYAPPYSILFWDDVVLRGNATATICVLEREYKKLLQCDNVRLFYFQDDTDVITDLSHYRDYSHYDEGINHYMYEAMRDGTHEIHADTYFDVLLDMYDFVTAYDYEQCFH